MIYYKDRIVFLVFRLSFKLGWLKRASLLIIGMLSLVLVPSSCKSSPKFTYPELSTTLTEIVVKDNDSWEQIKTIRDQHQIDSVVKFINSQRSGWSPPRFGFPITKLELFLYHEGTFKGSFGISKSSFSMQRKGRYDSKPATEKEVEEILKLIGIEKRMLEWN